MLFLTKIKQPQNNIIMEEYTLTQDKREVFKGTENQCYYKLQRSQSFSASWAMKYEGWRIQKSI